MTENILLMAVISWKKRTSLASRPCRKKPCKPTSESDTPDTDSQAPVLIHPR
jgi:hypothetical protein